MSKRIQPIAIIPDTHAPYNDVRHWRLLIKVLRDFKPHTVVHQGDWTDCYAISRFSKDPMRKLRFEDELELVKSQRTQIDLLEPKRKVFTEGNHEDRWPRYIFEKAPEAAGVIPSMDELLKMSENGWEYVPYRQHTQVGKCYFTHDVGNGGKYPTAGALDVFQTTVCVAHHHRMQYFVMGDATGDVKLGASFGWLGDINEVDYMHQIKVRKLWAPGFGLGYHDTKTDAIHTFPVPIVDNRCIVGGKVYEV